MAAARLAVALILSLAVSRVVAAPPDVKALIPAGAQRGQTVEVALKGTLPKGSLRVWTSSDDLTFEPTKKPEVFQVRVDEGAAPGPRWVRFIHDDEGPSGLKVFMVGAVAETAEVEPNDAVAKAQKIEADPLVVNGVLSQSGDVDCYRVTLQAKQTLVASLDAWSALGSPIDAALQVTDADGHVLVQNHDERGFDPLLTFVVPRDGEYVVRVFALASVPNTSIRLSGSEDATYRLTLTAGPFVEQAWPPVVNSSESAEVVLRGFNLPATKPIALPAASDATSLRRAVPNSFAGYASVVSLPSPVLTEGKDGFSQTPGKLALPGAAGGLLLQPGEKDAFVLTAKKGESFRVRVYAKALCSPVDPVVHVYKPDGTLLVRLDDISPRADYDVDGTAAATADGEYRLTVEDVFGDGGPRFFYVLDVRPAALDFGLSVTAPELSAVLGKETEIPVTIDRPRGMTGDIEITIEGSPELADVKVTSPNKGAEAKKVSLKFTPMKPFAGPIRVVGRLAGSPEVRRNATAPFAAIPNTRTDLLWLTVSKTEIKAPPPKKK